MKKLTFALLLMTVFSSAALAQSSVIKINLFSPIVRTFNVAYEKVIKKDASFQTGFFYTGYQDSGNISYQGFGITPEYRKYVSDSDAPVGVYFAPFVRFQNFTLKNEFGDKGTLTTLGAGLVVGKQCIFKQKFSLDGFVGPSFSGGKVKTTSGNSFDVSGGLNGFGVRLGLTLGLAF